jgi:hypothetical protein
MAYADMREIHAFPSSEFFKGKEWAGMKGKLPMRL